MNKQIKVTSVLSEAFPTKPMQWALLALLSSPLWSIEIAQALSIIEWLEQLTQKILAKRIVQVSAVVLILAFIILDFALLVKNKIEHTTILHINNEHEFLSLKWFVANAKYRHYIAVILLIGVPFLLGRYACN